MTPCGVVMALAVLAAPALEAATPADGEEEYISLERPAIEIQELGERCPVRVEMPLPGLKVDGRKKTFAVVARYVHCGEVRISHIIVQARKGRLGQVELHASAHVIAPKGRDSDASLEYELVTGDGEAHSARQYLELDEGERNWGGGVSVPLPASVDLESLLLRLEMTTPTE